MDISKKSVANGGFVRIRYDNNCNTVKWQKLERNASIDFVIFNLYPDLMTIYTIINSNHF